MIQLKPCPFCGEEVERKYTKSGMVLVCPTNSPCHGSGLATVYVGSNIYDLVDVWNRRASDPIQPTLHDMVAMAALTGLVHRDDIHLEDMHIHAHKIARAYCATREKDMGNVGVKR